MVIKALKGNEKIETPQNTVEDFESMIDSLKNFHTKVKTFKIKKVEKKDKRIGLLDSGATRDVRAIKKDENYADVLPKGRGSCIRLRSQIKTLQKQKR